MKTPEQKNRIRNSQSLSLPWLLLLLALLALGAQSGWAAANFTNTYSTAGTYTWTVPAMATSVTIECWGGGGGGGGTTRGDTTIGAAAGGAGGAYARVNTYPVTSGTTFTITVGAAGAGGAAGNNPGTAGGDSSCSNSLGVVCFAKGGGPGAGNSVNTPGTCPAGSIGDVTYLGGSGAAGLNQTLGVGYGGGGGSSAGTNSNGNVGYGGALGLAAAAVPGGGPGGAARTNGNPGIAPVSGPGGGGGGAYSKGVNPQAGGAGWAGKVVISYTLPFNTLNWLGDGGNNRWSTNAGNICWDSDANGVADAGFNDGDVVSFGTAGSANPTVNIETRVAPTSLTFNTNSGYTLNGSGKISGAAALVQSGPGTVTISLANDYSGGTTLSAGRLRLGNANALGTSLVSLSGGALSSDGATPRTIANPVKVTIASTFGDTSDNGAITLTAPVDCNGAARALTINSATVFGNGVTNGAVGNKQGPATLTIRGNVIYNASEDVTAGTLIYDTATVQSTFRVIPDATANAVARLVITNGSSVTVSNANNNLRCGLAGDVTGTNYLDLAGLFSCPGANLPNGSATLYGGCAYAEMTFWPGGDFTAFSVTNSSGSFVGNTTFKFNGGILRALTNNAHFFEGISQALVQPGGAIIDDRGFAIVINQNLQDGGGGLTKLGSGTLTLSGANTYTGTTLVSSGTLAESASASFAGAITVANNAVLSVAGAAGTLYLPALTLGAGGSSSLNLDLGANGNPFAAPLSVGTLTANGSVRINLTGQKLTPGQFSLVQFSSASGLANFQLGSLPPGVSATLVRTANSLDLNVQDAVNVLTWTGAADNQWNTTSLDWANVNNGNSPISYAQSGGFGDMVTFDDSATGPTTISVAQTVTPVSVTFNNGNDTYSFSGPGKISGGASLVLNNFNPVVLGMANDYTGGTVLQGGGWLYVGNDQALGQGPLTLNIGTLASDSTTARTLANAINVTADTGLTLGDPVNTGTLTLAGTVDLGGANTRALNFKSDVLLSGSMTNGSFSSKTGSGRFTIRGHIQQSVTVVHNQGDVILDGGRIDTGNGWRIQNTSPGTTLRFAVTNGGVFSMTTTTGNVQVGYTGGDSSANNILDIAGTLSLQGNGSNGSVKMGTGGANDLVYLRSGGLLSCYSVSGTSPAYTEVDFDGGTLMPNTNNTAFLQGVTNAYVLAGGLTVDTAGFNVTIPQALQAGGTGTGGLTKLGNGTLTLSGSTTYGGPTLVNGGKLVLGPTFASAGAIQVGAGATVALLSSSPGVVVPVSAITGAAGAAIEVQFSGTSANPSSPAAVITNLVLNGAVAVNVSATGLTAGQFPLLGYATISGSGRLVVGQVQLPAGLNGSIVTNAAAHTIDLLVGAATPPQIGRVSVSGGNLNLSGTGGTGGATYYVYSSTNVARPLASWLPVQTNTFAPDGSFSASLPVNPAEPQRFFILRLQ